MYAQRSKPQARRSSVVGDSCSAPMKPNTMGIRLVQRKFAQGVPVPASHAPPVPPERKAEPPKERRTVYHSHMSARNLLDILSLQSVHKHKQPMVILERLRVNDIPTPPPPIVIKKKRLAHKARKNNMALRSRQKRAQRLKKAKKESPQKKRTPPARKLDEMSSATDDDTPLMYLRRNSPRKPSVRSEEPTSSTSKSSLGTTITKKQDSKNTQKNTKFKRPATGLKVRSKQPRLSRSSSISSTFSSSVTSIGSYIVPRSVSRAPARLLKRRAEPTPTPAPAPEASPPPFSRRTLRPRATPVPRTRTPSGQASSEAGAAPKTEVPRTRTLSGQASSEAVAPAPKTEAPAAGPSREPSPLAEPSREPLPPACSCRAFTCVDDVLKADASGSPLLLQRCRACRECAIVDKILQLKLLVREEGANPAAIYDFHAEVEEAISPSISTYRNRQNTDRADGEQMYLDILSPETPQIMQIICKTTADQQTVSVRVVDRDMALNVERPSLTEHESLLDHLVACMNRRAQLAAQARQQDQSAQAERPRKKLRGTRNIARNTRKREEPSSPINGSQELAIEPERSERAPTPPAEVPASPPSPAPHRLLPRDAHVFKQPAVRHRPANAKPSTPRQAATVPKQPAVKPIIAESSRSGAPSMSEDFAPEDLGPSASVASSVTGLPQTLLDAPVFRPSVAEFTDPIEFYKKIRPFASKYGLCKIVPPAGFSPPCVLGDHIRFAVIHQYISKLYNRWGPLARELAAIKVLLRMQKVVCNRAPLLNGCEVSLPKLYHAVERHGGLTKVMHRKRWGRVAEDMKLTNCPNPEGKLDKIYMRYLLPYATLSDKERQNIMAKVENHWTATKYKKMLTRARNPLHAQKRMLGESDTSSDEDESDTGEALAEAEDCITPGRLMNLATFRKVAKTFMESQFPSGRPDTDTVERAYWRAILLGTEHIVANTASIDTGEEGHGFPKEADAPCGNHPWNLKVLASNPGNVLRYLGPVLGVTVPTLHLSMLFSTCCWHRDPHGLPWVEYLHSGPEKIWYGIPGFQSDNFRRAVETLCPAYCQNKSIWLASDIAMIPPEILTEHGVALARVEQKPGEFVMVFPEAHSCSITTGFSVSESVYFAPNTWFDNVHKLFQELRESCEPTMFSLEKLLLKGAEQVGGAAVRVLASRLQAELRHRDQLQQLGVPVVVSEPSAEQEATWSARVYDECEFCRASLYLSKVTGASNRRSPLCPEHALQLLRRSRLGGSLQLHTALSDGALRARLARLGGGMWGGLQPIANN